MGYICGVSRLQDKKTNPKSLKMRVLGREKNTRLWQDQWDTLPIILAYLQHQGTAKSITDIVRLGVDKVIHDVFEEMKASEEVATSTRDEETE